MSRTTREVETDTERTDVAFQWFSSIFVSTRTKGTFTHDAVRCVTVPHGDVRCCGTPYAVPCVDVQRRNTMQRIQQRIRCE